MKILLLTAGKMFSILLIFFLPGYMTILLFKQKKSFSFIISILLSSLTGLFLAQTGHFSLINLIRPLAVFALILFIVWLRKNPTKQIKKEPSRKNWLLLAVLALALFLFFRPHEYLEGGWDPGTYLNTGINIAKTGSIKIQDETWAGLDSREQKIFSHTRAQIEQKYPGFMVINPASGLIMPRFYHLYSVWIAILYSLFGLKFSLYLNPFLALFGLFYFYQAALLLFNRKTALLAVLFLSLSPIQIWYARFSTSEILSQFLLWSSIYLLALYEEKKEPFMALMGGVTLGTAFLSSLTTILILPAIIFYFFYRNWGKVKHSDLFFIIPFSLLILYLIFQTIFFTKDYVYNIYFYHYKFNPLTKKIIIGLTAGSFILIILKIFSLKTKPFFDRLGQKQYLRAAFAFILIFSSFYAYFFRGRVKPFSFNATNLPELALFLSPLGIWLGISGMVFLLWRGFSRKKTLFVLFALTFSFIFIRNKVLAPHYPWALRRYVPFIIPSFYLLSSFMIVNLAQWKKTLGKIACTAAALYLSIFPLYQSFPLVKQVDYQGMIKFSEDLAGQMKERAVYICNGYWLATPLHFIYGKNTLSFSDQNIPKGRQVISSIEKWLKEGREVFYLTRENKPFTPGVDFQEAGSVLFQSSRLEQPLRQLPREIKLINNRIKIFKLKLLDRQTQPKKGKYFIDVGHNCFGLAGGFDRGRNYSGGITARWTYESAEIVLPWPAKEKEVTLTLKMGGRRPAEEKSAKVSVYLDNNFIKEIEVSNKMQEYQLILPAAITTASFPSRSVLKLISTTWNPHQYGIKGYNSNLGVLVDWIKVGF